MPKVAILVTLMDAGVRTAACMEECQRQAEEVAAEGKYSFSFYLNDNGAAGFLAAREKARKDGADFYLWVDGNLRLKEGAIPCFLENSEFLRHKAVIAGTVSAPDKSPLYGGRTRRGRIIEPDPVIPVPCHLFDMEFVLVPEYAFTRLEVASDFFRRSLLGYGFGTKVAKADVARVVAPGVLASTDILPAIQDWRNPDVPLHIRARGFLHSVFGR